MYNRIACTHFPALHPTYVRARLRAASSNSRSIRLMLIYNYFFRIGTIDERDAGDREADGGPPIY